MTRTQLKWVLINRAARETGYTQAAIRTKLRRGVWRQGQHWLRAPDNRIFINIEAVQEWVTQGKR
jgi:hypothetical protein